MAGEGFYKLFSQDERQKINEFLLTENEKVTAEQKEEHYMTSPFYGAIGGELTYLFTPTGLGMVIKVRHNYTLAELDLTHYVTILDNGEE